MVLLSLPSIEIKKEYIGRLDFLLCGECYGKRQNSIREGLRSKSLGSAHWGRAVVKQQNVIE